MGGTYNCSRCVGQTPCCWENPATWRKVAAIERGIGYDSGQADPPRGVVWRWRFRWWPLHITLRIRWRSLAKAHKGLHP